MIRRLFTLSFKNNPFHCLWLIPGLILVFNVIIDPMGRLNIFDIYFNKVKMRVDERIMKFDSVRDHRHSNIILGNSKVGVIDGEEFGFFNAGFAGGKMDEFVGFVDELRSNGHECHTIFFG